VLTAKENSAPVLDLARKVALVKCYSAITQTSQFDTKNKKLKNLKKV
jgi:hypothetical protein